MSNLRKILATTAFTIGTGALSIGGYHHLKISNYLPNSQEARHHSHIALACLPIFFSTFIPASVYFWRRPQEKPQEPPRKDEIGDRYRGL